MTEVNNARHEIIVVSESGLLIRLNDIETELLWTEIPSASAVMSLWDHTSDRRVQVIVFSILAGADERLLLVEETEAVWQSLVAVLSKVLPGVPSYEVWSQQLAETGAITLYAHDVTQH